jgi:protein-S-isoprenylcysteine O-methyltransferase Ste14
MSVAAFVLMVVGIIGLYGTDALFSRSPFVIAAQILAVVLMLWARMAFGRRSFHASADPTAGGLVTSGPYRFIRHPIYTAANLFAWAGVVAHPSSTSVLFGACVLAGAIVRMLLEERLVAATYPEYRQYAATTKRMVPYLF